MSGIRHRSLARSLLFRGTVLECARLIPRHGLIVELLASLAVGSDQSRFSKPIPGTFLALGLKSVASFGFALPWPCTGTGTCSAIWPAWHVSGVSNRQSWARWLLDMGRGLEQQRALQVLFGWARRVHRVSWENQKSIFPRLANVGKIAPAESHPARTPSGLVPTHVPASRKAKCLP